MTIPESMHSLHPLEQQWLDSIEPEWLEFYRMTPEQRRREVASLLANGLARLRSAGHAQSASMASESEFELGFSGHQRVHTDPVNNRNTESR